MQRQWIWWQATLCAMAWSAMPATSRGQAVQPHGDDTARPAQSASAWDSRLRALDVNRDGTVTFAEWNADDASFEAHDWDRDGILSGRELVADAVCPEIPPRAVVPGGESAEMTYERMDADHDYRLIRHEWTGTASEFARLDFNKDGVLSPFEFGIGR